MRLDRGQRSDKTCIDDSSPIDRFVSRATAIRPNKFAVKIYRGFSLIGHGKKEAKFYENR